METEQILIPTEVAAFATSGFGIVIEWINPFEDFSIFEFTDDKGRTIHKRYIEVNDVFVIPAIVGYMTKSYSVEFRNIRTGEAKVYSIACA